MTSRTELAALTAKSCKIAVSFYWAQFFSSFIYGLASPQLWRRLQPGSVGTTKCWQSQSIRAVLGVAGPQVRRLSGKSDLCLMMCSMCCSRLLSSTVSVFTMRRVAVISPSRLSRSRPQKRNDKNKNIFIRRKSRLVNMIKFGKRNDLNSSRYRPKFITRLQDFNSKIV